MAYDLLVGASFVPVMGIDSDAPIYAGLGLSVVSFLGLSPTAAGTTMQRRIGRRTAN